MGRQQQRLQRQLGGAGDLLQACLDAERQFAVELAGRARGVGGALQARHRDDGQAGQGGFPILTYAGIGQGMPFQRHEVAEPDRRRRRQPSDAASQAVKVALDPFGQEGGDAPAVEHGMVEADAEMDLVVRDQVDVDPAAGSLAPVVAPAALRRDVLG